MSDRTIVLGGGPAGAAAAILLARAGKNVIILERTTSAHEKVCGDFFSGEAQDAARALHVDAVLHGAPAIGEVRLHANGRVACARLPFPAFGFSRRALDAGLLEAAAQAGADLRRGVTARAVEPDAHGVRIDGDRVARALVATGKHQMRGAPRDVPAGRAVGWKMRLRLAPDQRAELLGAIELFPLPGGYAGLNETEDGASLCAVFPPGWAGDFATVAARLSAADPVLAQRLRDAQPLLAKPLAVAGMAYGRVQRDAAHPALYRVGDQAVQIASVTGDGVAIALRTGAMAASCVLAGEDAHTYARHVRRAFGGQLRVAEIARAALRWPQWTVAACGAAPALMTLAARLTRVADRPALG